MILYRNFQKTTLDTVCKIRNNIHFYSSQMKSFAWKELCPHSIIPVSAKYWHRIFQIEVSWANIQPNNCWAPYENLDNKFRKDITYLAEEFRRWISLEWRGLCLLVNNYLLPLKYPLFTGHNQSQHKRIRKTGCPI